ncbi:hypothetical protein AX14_003491 [Amanita brunnescens Koide BX004]|nr:hypothetical protein AX14_003491 [Amanita brunnescens Koide BX004]
MIRSAMAYFLTLSSLLPLDVLRLIFEFAAADDKRTGVVLSTVSKRVQRWVEPILYSLVDLQRPQNKHLFLRTIETSNTKKASFFTRNVKTLSIAHDPNTDDHQAARILSACRGVTNLTYLSIAADERPRIDFYPPSRHQSPAEGTGFPIFKLGLSLDLSLPIFGKVVRDQTALILRKQHAMELRTVLSELRPTHVSTLLPVSGPEANMSTPSDESDSSHSAGWSKPALPISLNLRLLLHTTHISIQNKWEDWVSWAGYFELARMPHLTHLSLDLRAGFSLPRSKNARANDAVFPEMDSHDAERACILARASQCILTQCPRLRICALRLVFDSNPDRTAAAILAQMPLSKHASRPVSGVVMETSKVVKQEDMDMMDVERGEDEESEEEDDEDDGIINMVDPRLVFLWDKEPFHQRDSHSKKEYLMWKKAEEAVERQSIGLGHIVIPV